MTDSGRITGLVIMDPEINGLVIVGPMPNGTFTDKLWQVFWSVCG